MAQAAAETQVKILDLAEELIRKSGYNGFSFREIATGVGVKSSSVHYYFPTKADLGAKVARRYTDRFMNALGEPQDASKVAMDVVSQMHGSFAEALAEDGQMCLCGVLAAESAGLPSEVAEEARVFFSRTASWLNVSLQKSDWGQGRASSEIERQSLAVLAQLEGGLLIARVQQQPELFNLLTPRLSTE
jgi:TetR/AcrR family transcriptional regulator, transcriptional repressor for nem operon